MSKPEALIAAVRARREAAGLNVKLVDQRDGHVTAVSCATADQIADLKRPPMQMSDQTRNLNPTPDAVAAMYVYSGLYAGQRRGPMDFWDGLTQQEKDFCQRLVRAMKAAITKHPEAVR